MTMRVLRRGRRPRLNGGLANHYGDGFTSRGRQEGSQGVSLKHQPVTCEVVIRRYTAIYIQAGTLKTIAPDCKERFVIDWRDAKILIPWPRAMTPKEAILAWAEKEMKKP